MATIKTLITKNKINPEPTELIAESIIKLSDAFIKLKKPGLLNDRALCLLLKDMTGVSFLDIKKILNAIPQLKDNYIIKSPNK